MKQGGERGDRVIDFRSGEGRPCQRKLGNQRVCSRERKMKQRSSDLQDIAVRVPNHDTANARPKSNKRILPETNNKNRTLAELTVMHSFADSL